MRFVFLLFPVLLIPGVVPVSVHFGFLLFPISVEDVSRLRLPFIPGVVSATLNAGPVTLNVGHSGYSTTPKNSSGDFKQGASKLETFLSFWYELGVLNRRSALAIGGSCPGAGKC